MSIASTLVYFFFGGGQGWEVTIKVEFRKGHSGNPHPSTNTRPGRMWLTVENTLTNCDKATITPIKSFIQAPGAYPSEAPFMCTTLG